MIVIDCSCPPSANRKDRIGKNRKTGKAFIYKNPRIKQWAWELYLAGRAAHPLMGALPITTGRFDLEILISTNRDADNSAKVTLDTMQELGWIINDKQARKVTQELVDKNRAPLGCRLRIIPLG